MALNLTGVSKDEARILLAGLREERSSLSDMDHHMHGEDQQAKDDLAICDDMMARLRVHLAAPGSK